MLQEALLENQDALQLAYKRITELTEWTQQSADAPVAELPIDLDIEMLDNLSIEAAKGRVQDALYDVRSICLNVSELERDLAGQAILDRHIPRQSLWDVADEVQKSQYLDMQQELSLMLRQSKELVKYLIGRCGGVTPSVLEITGMGITGMIHRELGIHHYDINQEYEPVSEVDPPERKQSCGRVMPHVVNRATRVLRTTHVMPINETEESIMGMVATGGCSLIVNLHDVYYNGETCICVVDSFIAGTLMDRLITKRDNQERYSERAAKHTMHQLVGALLFTHTVGYAHLDVRPENLIMASTYDKSEDHETCKLFGFRSAVRVKGWQEQKATVGGVFGYTAPEILTGEVQAAPDLLPLADIFSAGVVLFQLLCVTSPFSYSKSFASDEAHFVFEPLSAWGGISERAKHLVTKMLAKSPHDRLTAAQVLEHPWMTDAPGFTDEDNFVTPSMNEEDPEVIHPLERTVTANCDCEYCVMMRDPALKMEFERDQGKEAEAKAKEMENEIEAAKKAKEELKASVSKEELEAEEAEEALKAKKAKTEELKKTLQSESKALEEARSNGASDHVLKALQETIEATKRALNEAEGEFRDLEATADKEREEATEAKAADAVAARGLNDRINNMKQMKKKASVADLEQIVVTYLKTGRDLRGLERGLVEAQFRAEQMTKVNNVMLAKQMKKQAKVLNKQVESSKALMDRLREEASENNKATEIEEADAVLSREKEKEQADMAAKKNESQAGASAGFRDAFMKRTKGDGESGDAV